MKVSINRIREINRRYLCAADPMPDGINKLVEKIGAQLGAVDEVIDLGKKYEGIVVAKIVSCVKHPNADKLSICLIDDGGVVKGVKRDKDGLVQVVCGAPNAKAALAVAWIPPGVVVPVTADKDPFKLESREIRGETSNGMLASPKELDLGDSHEGVLEIEEKVKPGQPFAEVYGLNDYIIDIENKMFTHRPDLFGMLGIARELAGIQGHVFKSPEWYVQDAPVPAGRGTKLALTVSNKLTKQVPRFMILPVAGVEVKPSPVWLQTYLSRIGIRPINNIVDITNFVMLETAQPLHAYDYDKLKKLSDGEAKIEVRLSKSSEELTLLGGKRMKLKDGAVVIATNKQAIGLGGVMGGAETEVDESTRNIVLESGTFDMNLTRKTAMGYGLFTDAATRFTKNQSPLQNKAALSLAVAEIMKLAGGRVAGPVTDIRTGTNLPKPVNITSGFINERLGLTLTASQVGKILERVEFKVAVKEEKLTITAPFWRMDVGIPEDIVEEVGRLYGYDRLPQKLPQRDIAPAGIEPILEFKSRLRNILAHAGANEVLTYSFINGRLLELSGQDTAKAYHIRNALSPDLQYYRQSLAPSLLEKIHPNIKSGTGRFALFELGRVRLKGVLDDEKLPAELHRLGLVVASKEKLAGAAYFWAKAYLEDLFLNGLAFTNFKYLPLAEDKKLPIQWHQAANAYEPGRSAVIYSGHEPLGLIGEPTDSLKTGLKLPAAVAQLEIDIDKLHRLVPPIRPYHPLNRFPSIEQDINLRLESAISYERITDFIVRTLTDTSGPHGYHFIWRPLDIYQKPGDSGHKQITWRIILSHPERTLTMEESNRLLDELASRAKAELDAQRV